jgi:pyruvate kinase
MLVNHQSRVSAATSSRRVAPEVMATLGPTLEKPEDLKRAIEAGATWFRFPCGYRQRPHLENARALRSASAQVGIPIRLLLDLPSSRPRTGKMEELRLSLGDRVLFWDSEECAPKPAANGEFHVPVPGLAHLIPKLAPGHRMWFCDGRLSFVVEALEPTNALARLEYGAIPLKSSNSLFLPDSPSPFAVLTEEDRLLMQAFAADGIIPDWVALSLIASPDDVEAGRRETGRLLGPTVRMMAKFETQAAVACADDIIAVSEGIMVARGDLGLAVGYVRLPEAQEFLLAAARRAGKVAVVATQVLEVFAETGVPQRAELSDLSLIARQGATAVMLGRETVFSPRPIECIRFAREVLVYETQRFAGADQPAGPPARSRHPGSKRKILTHGPERAL